MNRLDGAQQTPSASSRDPPGGEHLSDPHARRLRRVIRAAWIWSGPVNWRMLRASAQTEGGTEDAAVFAQPVRSFAGSRGAGRRMCNDPGQRDLERAVVSGAPRENHGHRGSQESAEQEAVRG